MHHTHQPILVAFSVVIAVLASYTALELAVSIAEQTRHRFVWIAAGAVAQGTGIWSMHFVAMLAFTIPGVQIRYAVPLVIVSYGIAIAGSCLALYAASRREMTRAKKVVCSLAMGAGIAGLHYTAIGAMRMPAAYDWSYLLVAASVAIAIFASGAGLWLSIEFRSDLSIRGFFMRAGAAVVLGGAISGMHYTGMAAMVSWRHGAVEPAPGGVLATPALATLVIGASHLILGIAIAGCGVNRALALGRQRTKTGEALDALRARDEFLSIAAHELHTPVHSLQLVVQGVRSGMLALRPTG